MHECTRLNFLNLPLGCPKTTGHYTVDVLTMDPLARAAHNTFCTAILQELGLVLPTKTDGNQGDHGHDHDHDHEVQGEDGRPDPAQQILRAWALRHHLRWQWHPVPDNKISRRILAYFNAPAFEFVAKWGRNSKIVADHGRWRLKLWIVAVI